MHAPIHTFSTALHAPAAALGCLLTLMLLSTGCAVHEAVMPTGKRVSLADFANSQAGEVVHDAADQEEGRIDDSEIAQVPLAAVSESLRDDPDVLDREPDARPAALRRLRPGESYIVDSLVGQINGRPIYADSFFAPIENQLISERMQLGDVAFRDRAWNIIVTHLRTLIEDELFLAEAQASLKPEERQGLFAFMRHIRERTIALAGGTQTGAQQRLQELGEADTIDQYVRGRLDEELIRRLLQDKILPRAIVTWRDVEREYRRRHNEFNPPPTLHLSRIRVPNDDAETMERVKTGLAKDEPFANIAESIGQGDGHWQAFTVGPEGIHDISISDTLKPHLKGLNVGDTTEPIELATATMWLHLSKLEEVSRSLYDLEVQRALQRYLHNERVNVEKARYLESLLQQRVYDDLTEMAQRLLSIALDRYGSVGRGGLEP